MTTTEAKLTEEENHVHRQQQEARDDQDGHVGISKTRNAGGEPHVAGTVQDAR